MNVANVPKAELHVHIEGTISPSLAQELAAGNGIELPEDLPVRGDRFHWPDFNRFLDGYDLIANCIRCGADYERVVYDYLKRCAAENVIYVEFFGSQDHGEQSGLSYSVMLEHLVRAIDRAEAEFGIVCRIIMTCIRHLGPERAQEVARTAAAHPHPYVVGFGMAGDEKAHSPADFSPAFAIASEAGLACTVHAGEVCGPESVRDALDSLPVSRIGHGVRAIEDEALLVRLREQEIALEVCPGSNVALGVYDGLSGHPFPDLREAGCIVTLGSDDPPHFGTTIGTEYHSAAELWGFGYAELTAITRDAVKVSFADAETKAKLLDKLSEK